jgi:cytosine/adenosine deaminase-related metal-dependent hydrolase
MLQELGYASRHYGITSGELVGMATSVPASLVRISDYIGTLSPGSHADFIVIDAKVDPSKPNPLDPVVKATPANVTLVVVGGQPVYGDEKLLKQLLPNAEVEKIRVYGADKAVAPFGRRRKRQEMEARRYQRPPEKGA